MAINILTEPADPPGSGDYTRDQAIQHSAEVPNLSILSGWESTGAEPVAKQGSFIRHAGNTFQIQSSDATISGTPTAGLNYIIATETSGVITLAWASSITGYSYNPAYGGIYNGAGLQALRDILYLDGADYNRGMTFGEDYNSYRLADGSLLVDGDITASGYLASGQGVKCASTLMGTKTESEIYTWLSSYVTATSGKIKINGSIYGGSTLLSMAFFAQYLDATNIGIQGGSTTGGRLMTFTSGGGLNYTVYLAI